MNIQLASVYENPYCKKYFHFHTVGASANGNGAQASVVRVTRLSTTAASVELTYFHQPGQSLHLSVFNISRFSVNPAFLSEQRVFYDYLYDGLVVHQLDYCFGIAGISSVENESIAFDNSLACSKISEIVQTGKHHVC